MECREVFQACMAHGNQLNDQANKSTLLILAEALTVMKDVPVELKKEVFLAGEQA